MNASPIDTARLRLRPFALDDAPRLAALLNDFELSRWLARVPHPYGIDDALRYLEGPALHRFLWAITPRDDSERGVIGAVGVDPHLGYWLGRAYWGQGLMTEAAAAALDAYRAQAEPGPLRSGHFEGNHGSRRVLERLGFVETGRSQAMSLSLGRMVVHVDMTLP